MKNNDLGSHSSIENLKQLSLVDSLNSESEAPAKLDDINERMDWEATVQLI